MLKLHHLEHSRSTRIIWLMEELGASYELIVHERNPETMRAPEELTRVHPVGKAPVLEDGNLTLAESGAIIEYVIGKYGAGKLAPREDSLEHARYLELLHFAEGSAMFPILVLLVGGMTGGLSDNFRSFVTPDVHKNLDYIGSFLDRRDYLLESGFSGADIQMSYVIEAARMGNLLAGKEKLTEYLARIEQRPAYRRAIEKGGVVALDLPST